MPFVGWIPTETDTAINLFDPTLFARLHDFHLYAA